MVDSATPGGSNPGRASGSRLSPTIEQGAGERERSDREVDVEGPAPAQVGDEPAADERAERRHPADHRAPDPEGDRSLAPAEGRVHDRERRREDQRSAHPLEEAAGEEDGSRGRERGDQARAEEDQEAPDEHATAPGDVADAADADQERGEDQRVDRVRPLRLGDPDVEVADDRRNRDIDDRRVDDDHRHADRQRDEAEPAVAVVRRRGQALVLCYPLAAGAQCPCGGVIRPRLVVALSAVSRGA